MSVIYEVDIRSYETGDTIETIYKGDSDTAYQRADEWNSKNKDKMLFADVYHNETEE